MRGTLARKLRKEAQGNEALYDVEKEVSDPWFDVISQKVLQSVVYISTMQNTCSRYKYKQLKKQFKNQ